MFTRRGILATLSSLVVAPFAFSNTSRPKEETFRELAAGKLMVCDLNIPGFYKVGQEITKWNGDCISLNTCHPVPNKD